MEKKKRKPLWRKSYIKIITEKKADSEPDSVPCEYCGSPMPSAAIYCPGCGRPRKEHEW
jgi:predicted amidophosphoribosyltransferase